MSATTISKPPGTARAALTVFFKEVIDALRDRRTLFLTLFGSVISGPLILLLLFKLISSEVERAEQLKLPVAGAEHAPALIAYLERERIQIQPPPEDFQAKIRSGEVEVVLEIDPRFAEDVAAGSPDELLHATAAPTLEDAFVALLGTAEGLER